MLRIEQDKTIQWFEVPQIKINWFDELQHINLLHYQIEFIERKTNENKVVLKQITESSSSVDQVEEVTSDVKNVLTAVKSEIQTKISKINSWFKNTLICIAFISVVAAVVILILIVRNKTRKREEPLISIRLKDLVENSFVLSLEMKK